MDLRTTIELNKQIMELIARKHDQLFPHGSNTPESRYYRRLNRDTEDAERHLQLTAVK